MEYLLVYPPACIKGLAPTAMCCGFSSQRIAGSSVSPTLQYFGRSLSARLDLDGDELIDLAVGAQGSAVLLR